MTQRLVIFIIFIAFAATACAQTAPSWYLQESAQVSAEAPYLSAVGTGESIDLAQQDALGTLVNALYAEVSRKTATGYYETNETSDTYVAGTTLVETDTLPIQNVDMVQSEQVDGQYFARIQVAKADVIASLEAELTEALSVPAQAPNNLVQILALIDSNDRYESIQHYLPVLRGLSANRADKIAAQIKAQRDAIAALAEKTAFTWQSAPSLQGYAGDIAARVNEYGLSEPTQNSSSGADEEQWLLIVSGQSRGGKQGNVPAERQHVKQLQLNLRWHLNGNLSRPAISSQLRLVGFGASAAAAEQDLKEQLQQLPTANLI